MIDNRETTFQVFREIESSEQLGILTFQIISCITKAFGHPMPEDEVESALKGSLIIIAKNADTVIGYASLHKETVEHHNHGEFDNIPIGSNYFSLEAGVVDLAFQGQGIYKQLNSERIKEVIVQKAPLLTTHTQNPKVEKGIVSILEELVLDNLLKSFEVRRIKLSGFYGRRLTSYPLVIPSGPFEELDIDAGDAYFLQFYLQY